MNPGRILLIAGGTGGHIMPALSFGSWAAKNRCAEVGYVCGTRAMERDIYFNAGAVPMMIHLDGSPLSGGITMKKRAERTLAMVTSLAEARKILRDFRPDCCVLFGGYISLPFLAMCRVMRIPALVHEQNACAGLVTKLAAGLGLPVLTGWDACFPLKRKRFTRVGVPVRTFKQPDRGEALNILGIPEPAPGSSTAVVFSGSLGSVPIKEKILEISSREYFRDWLFLLPSVAEKTEKIGDNVWVLPKIWDPSPLFAAADYIVTRAGGSILTEIATLGLPALVIPWRGAANDHQFYNASAFLSENTGIILDLENDSGLLASRILELRGLTGACMQKKVSRLYNKADIICEKLWEALPSKC